MAFTKDLVVVAEVDDDTWQLVEPVIYHGNTESFTVPAGFRTDFASVPRVLAWLVPRYGAYTKAAILHDYLCRTGVVSRADADGIFRRSMRELNVPLLRRWIMWAAVRLGGRLSGAGAAGVALWAAVAVPSMVFVAVPVIVVFVWLLIYWVVEFLVFLVLRPFGRERVNRPRFLLRLS